VNVVCIVSDQHNAEFTGCYGGRTRTPNLDRLAGEGARFDACWCAYPICAPSRASWFAGRYAHEIGCWDNATPYDGGRPDWGTYLRECGVLHAVTGKLDFTERGTASVERPMTVKIRRNWDVTGLFRDSPPATRPGSVEQFWQVEPADAPDEPHGTEEQITREAVRFLESGRPADRPWVLAVHYYKPHPPWRPDPERFRHHLDRVTPLAPKYLQPLADLSEAERVRSQWTAGYAGGPDGIARAHCAYHAEIEEVDRHVGRVLDAVHANGLAGDTLVIYTSDHGEQARAHGAWGKISMYEDSLRVPLLIRGPGVAAGLVRRQPVSLLDLYPTIAEAVGLRAPNFARGASLLALADAHGDGASRPDHAFAECHMFPRAATFAVRQGDWKLIETMGSEPLLFNLAEDPVEMHDLAGAGGVAAVALDRLRQGLHGLCDPHAVDGRARRDQRARIEQLAASGRLQQELSKRGFLTSTSRLIPDPQAGLDRVTGR
jgi:choline-sulfatase